MDRADLKEREELAKRPDFVVISTKGKHVSHCDEYYTGGPQPRLHHQFPQWLLHSQN